MKWSAEDLEQKTFCDWLRIQKRKKSIVTFFSIQNENRMSWAIKNKGIIYAIASKDKLMGKRKGVSDMCIILKNMVLFVEMKKCAIQLKTKLSYASIEVSAEQVSFINEASKSDVVLGTVAYGAMEAVAYVSQFIDTRPNKKTKILKKLDNPLDN